ncbi:MAG: trigger factor [Clostridia bacterium]|nr:trigger factor [Clostridia bacterium]
MNLKAAKKIGTNRYELEIEISPEEFSKAIDRSYKKNAKRISIPGFRKGKAPKNFIEKYYGKSVFYEDAVNDVYPDAMDEAIKEAKLDVINDRIDFDIVTIGHEEGLTFKVAVTVKPEVKIENYKGIEIKKKSTKVEEQDIDKEIESQRERNARIVAVDSRAAQDGDIVVIDFKGFVDGKALEGGESKNHTLKLGSHRFIPGFEEQILGHKKGESFSIDVKFPDDYSAKDLSGKSATFEVKIHEIKERQLPALDDEFAKDVSEFDTLEDYRKDVEKTLKEAKETEALNDIDDQIINKLNELLEGEIPEAMFENRINDDIKEFANTLKAQGLDINSYIKYIGSDKEALRKELRPMAVRQVKLRLALEKISELENLHPTEKEIEDKFKEYADSYKIDVEKIKTLIPQEDLILDLSCKKAIEFLRENAKVS